MLGLYLAPATGADPLRNLGLPLAASLPVGQYSPDLAALICPVVGLNATRRLFKRLLATSVIGRHHLRGHQVQAGADHALFVGPHLGRERTRQAYRITIG